MKQVTGISKYGMICAKEKYNLVKMLSIVLYMLLLHTTQVNSATYTLYSYLF